MLDQWKRGCGGFAEICLQCRNRARFQINRCQTSKSGAEQSQCEASAAAEKVDKSVLFLNRLRMGTRFSGLSCHLSDRRVFQFSGDPIEHVSKFPRELKTIRYAIVFVAFSEIRSMIACPIS